MNNCIGIIANDGINLLCGLLGIIKSGNTIVPINPHFPIERVLLILKDCNIDIVLTDSKNIENVSKLLQSNNNLHILNIDEIDFDKSEYNNEEIEISENQYCYVIYTSGSTGHPKAIPITNKHLVPLFLYFQKLFGLNGKTRVLQTLSYTFDFGLFEILSTVLFGGTLHEKLNNDISDSEEFARTIKRKGINTLHTTPSFLRNIILKRINLDTIRVLHVGGEKFTVDLLNTLKDLLSSDCEIYNGYGPSENTVNSTIYKYSSGSSKNHYTIAIPIGKPTANNVVYIKNSFGQFLPVGFSGELIIGGGGVSEGYLNQVELTNEKFIKEKDGIQYAFKSGDIGYWQTDGNVVFVERNDDQVKLNGYRIEIGEIERIISKIESINQVKIVVIKHGQKDSLCAYYTSEAKLEKDYIRSFLLDYFPYYMIPGYYIQLLHFPLNSSGKIDLKSLPEPGGNNELIQPRNPFERKMRDLWANVLNVERDKFGVNDNFFENGGDSLKATMLLSNLHREFDIKLNLSDIFQYPTIEGLKNCLKQSDTKQGFRKIQKSTEKKYYNLSSAQRRLYVLQQFDPNSVNYNISTAFKLEGKIHANKVEKIFQQIILRHESLRTIIKIEKEEPVQHILENADFELAYFDSNEESVDECIHAFIKPFDLSKPLLFRVALINVTSAINTSVLVVDMHHIISDGLSLTVLIEDFIKLYKGENLDNVRLQYKDYTEWQNSEEVSNNLNAQKEFWLDILKDDIPTIDLPADYPRPFIQSFKGDREFFKLEKDKVERLKHIASQNDLTLYMLLLGAFDIMLAKICNQEDIIVGTAVAGRPHSDLEKIVGMFVNMLCIRSFPKTDLSLRSFFKDLREIVLNSFDNQDFLYEDLVESLDIKRDSSRNPIFDVVFVLHNLEVEDVDIPNLKMENYHSWNKVSKFDLTFEAIEYDEGIRFNIEYCTDIFSHQTIERIIEAFQKILYLLSKETFLDTTIGDIEIISKNEKQKILYEFNDTESVFPETQTIIDIFEQQVKSTPSNVALVFKNSYLTYKKLDEQTNYLAGILIDKGLKSNMIVGILSERSFEMIIGILAIIKAGGVYLPIDTHNPPNRLRQIFNDCDLKLLLVQEKFKSNLSDNKYITVNLDKIESSNSEPKPINYTRPENLAYLIYTSGSTGLPKGVGIQHKSLINRLLWMRKEYGLQENDVFLQKTTYTFDVSVWELFLWVFSGSKLTLLEVGGEKDPYIILDSIVKQNISIIHFVPSMLSLFLNHLEQRYLKNSQLRNVICSGEELKISTLRRFYNVFDKNVALSNLYGPTEATIDVSYFNCSGYSGNYKVPIGKPIDNTQLIILDESKNICPIGVSGTLYIAGVGVGKGYLNKIELTDDKFTTCKYLPGTIYNTGDIAKWNSNGDIIFLGRKDHQVKVRGLRIELGEIETQLLKHDLVKEAVVIANNDELDDSSDSIVAYVVPDKNQLSLISNYLKCQQEGLISDNLYYLQNNLPVFIMNRNETDFMYNEIFVNNSYLKNGIFVKEGDVVLDIGANIGMFSIFLTQKFEDLKIYAIEPILPIFEVLNSNSRLYGDNIITLQTGVSNKNGFVEFNYYPHVSIISGIYSDQDEKLNVKNFIEQEVKEILDQEQLEDLIENRLVKEKYKCAVKTISDIIKENNIEEINLLKIDVEKAEMDVIEGIEERDWGKIHQVVIEVHEKDNKTNEIQKILEEKGFSVISERDTNLQETDLINLYASKLKISANKELSLPKPKFTSPIDYIDNARTYLKDNLPPYMVPDKIVLLDVLPINSNGKINRRLLPKPQNETRNYVIPEDSVENDLALLFSEVLVLPTEKISLNDDFFKLGGHSYKAIRLVTQVFKKFSVEISIKDVFEKPILKDLAELIRENAKKESKRVVINKSEKKEYYKVSSNQKRLFILNQLSKHSTVYNLPVAFEIIGELDVKKMEKAFIELIKANEVLRTRYKLINNQVYQFIDENIDFEIKLLNKNECLRENIHEFVSCFDMENSPLLRIYILEETERKHVILLDIHHIVSDAVSNYEIFNEVLDRYFNNLIKPKNIQYKDFAEWQYHFLNSYRLQDQKMFWLDVFKNEPAILNLPLDFPRGDIQEFEGGVDVFEIDEQVYSNVLSLAKDYNVTNYMILLSVYSILLSKYSSQKDIIIGLPIAGRNIPKTENIIGFFVNTIAGRFNPGCEKKYMDYLQEVKGFMIDAFNNQDYSFENLVEDLELERQSGRNPLFDVSFVLQNVENNFSSKNKQDDLVVNSVAIPINITHFDLHLQAIEKGTFIQMILEYSTKIFRKSTIKKFTEHYVEILRQVTENENILLEDINLSIDYDLPKLGLVNELNDKDYDW